MIAKEMQKMKDMMGFLKDNKKPILPTEREIEENPRARSAKLRVAEKLKDPI